MNCKHGLQEGTCAWCNNNGFEVKVNMRKVCVDPIVDEYNSKRKYFAKVQEDWTKDEIDIVYEEFKGLLNKTQMRKRIYETSLVLERSKHAVVWMIRHLFSKKELHRGIEVETYRKERGII